MYVNWGISCRGSEFFCFHYCYELAGHRSKVNGVSAVLYFPSGGEQSFCHSSGEPGCKCFGELVSLIKQSSSSLTHGLSFGGHGVTSGVKHVYPVIPRITTQ